MEHWLNENLAFEASDLSLWARIGIVVGIIVAAYLVDTLVRRLLMPMLRRMAAHTATQWDDILLSDSVCRSFSRILPPIVMAVSLPFALDGVLQDVISRFMAVYIIWNVCYFLSVLLRAVFNIFEYERAEKARSLRGILQTLQIVVWLIGAILMVSRLMDRSPVFLITGLGAAATVMMLVFQDSIKGLVAGIQLSLNNMVRVGDWICMPARGVDGEVIEITLSTVKVRGWDNTILTIPPYALITETFQNWRGMKEGDGRRLTRSVNVDMLTVQFLDAEAVERYKQAGYLPASAKAGVATNLEAMRGCLTQVLHKSSDINRDMTLMVRQLPAGSEGLPIQLYAFTRTKEWTKYEDIQARLVEYMLSVMPQFGLRPYQRRGADYVNG